MELLCERARSWASLRADRELSELESALLDSHLGRCRSCRAFARGIEDVAATLAAASLERPAPLALVLPRRRGRGAWLQPAAASTPGGGPNSHFSPDRSHKRPCRRLQPRPRTPASCSRSKASSSTPSSRTDCLRSTRR